MSDDFCRSLSEVLGFVPVPCGKWVDTGNGVFSSQLEDWQAQALEDPDGVSFNINVCHPVWVDEEISFWWIAMRGRNLQIWNV